MIQYFLERKGMPKLLQNYEFLSQLQEQMIVLFWDSSRPITKILI